MIGLKGITDISLTSCTFTGNWVYELDTYTEDEQATLIRIDESPADIIIQNNIFQQHQGFYNNFPALYGIDLSSITGIIDFYNIKSD